MMRRWPWDWERHKDDLREELESHLRLAIEDRVARGQSPEQARAEGIREMGNGPLVADLTRKQWGWERLERLGQDLRYAVRQLAKTRRQRRWGQPDHSQQREGTSGCGGG
jgi:hypothetical protein